MFKYLVLTIVVLGLILLTSGVAIAYDAPGCPGPEEWWEGECVIMPAEPPPLDDFVYIPMLMTGDVLYAEGCSCEFYVP